jgi:hypothetical protein
MTTTLTQHETALLHLENAAFRYEPYPIGIVRPVFEHSVYQDLLNAWPADELFDFMPKLGKKYSLSEVNNAAEYHKVIERAPLWGDIHSQIKSPAFVRHVLEILKCAGVDLGIPDDVPINQPASGAPGLARWAATLQPQRATAIKSRFEFSMLPADGGHIKPHTDSPGKLITLVVSFCDEREWQASFGGGTTVLRPLDQRQVFNHLNRQLEFADTEVLHEFPFEPNQCVIFVKTFNSLHAVSPMRGIGLPVMRRTLTINIELA